MINVKEIKMNNWHRDGSNGNTNRDRNSNSNNNIINLGASLILIERNKHEQLASLKEESNEICGVIKSLKDEKVNLLDEISNMQGKILDKTEEYRTLNKKLTLAKGELIAYHKPKNLKASFLDKNERYPYQRVMSSEDLKYFRARKLCCFNFDAGAKGASEGSRLTELDADFTKSVKVRNGIAAICRQNTARGKIFDITSGNEREKAIPPQIAVQG